MVSNATGLGLGNAYRDGKALFTTLVKTLQRDTLAGTAWDKSKPFATRLQAATKNYVYAKQEGDNRRASRRYSMTCCWTPGMLAGLARSSSR